MNDEGKIKRSIFLYFNLNDVSTFYKFKNDFLKHELLSNKYIDILINNAALTESEFKLTTNKIESNLQCNFLSPMIFTLVLLDLINPNEGRIINVSSDGHKSIKEIDFEKLEKDYSFELCKKDYDYWHMYCLSKLGNVYFNVTFAEFLEREKKKWKQWLFIQELSSQTYSKVHAFIIYFFIFYPIIWCFTKSPYRGAQTTLHLCYSNYEDLFNGNYYDNCQIGEISKLADNPDQRKRFMKYSAQLARNCYNDRIDDPELSRFINSLSN